MPETDQLSQVIASIYDAALDRRLWPEVLGEICEYVIASSVALASHDRVTSSSAFHVEWGLDPAFRQLYLETYQRIDPILPALHELDVGQVYTQFDILTDDAFRSTRFYEEWARPQGFIDLVGALIEKDAGTVSTLSFRRSEQDGRVDNDARHRVTLLTPHVRRSVVVGKLLDYSAAESADLSSAIERLGSGIVLVARDLGILHANETARSMLAASDPIRSIGGRLTVAGASAQAALLASVDQSVQDERGLRDRGIGIPIRFADGQAALIHVLPLPHRPAHHGIGPNAAAALFVTLRNRRPDIPRETLIQLYDLTPSEARVFGFVAEGMTREEIATAMGIAVSTVKTHMLRVFDKTGAKRQSDLVRLTAKLGRPD